MAKDELPEKYRMAWRWHHNTAFLDALEEAGIPVRQMNVTRMTIDLDVGELPMVTFECVASQGMADVIRVLAPHIKAGNVEIKVVHPEPNLDEEA